MGRPNRARNFVITHAVHPGLWLRCRRLTGRASNQHRRSVGDARCRSGRCHPNLAGKWERSSLSVKRTTVFDVWLPRRKAIGRPIVGMVKEDAAGAALLPSERLVERHMKPGPGDETHGM